MSCLAKCGVENSPEKLQADDTGSMCSGCGFAQQPGLALQRAFKGCACDALGWHVEDLAGSLLRISVLE